MYLPHVVVCMGSFCRRVMEKVDMDNLLTQAGSDKVSNVVNKKRYTTESFVRDIIGILNSIGESRGVETVFRDWCHCFALSLSNGCSLPHTQTWEQREEQYKQVIGKYTKEEVDQLITLCALLVELFEHDPFQDHLGNLYMELFGWNKKLGQNFTPIHLCKICAQTTIGTPLPEPKTLADECSGGGAMLIAACWWYAENKVDYQKYLKITCGDRDSLCVYMSYIQLSLIGARAEVWRRNAITHETFDLFVTPMEAMLLPLKYCGVNQDE